MSWVLLIYNLPLQSLPMMHILAASLLFCVALVQLQLSYAFPSSPDIGRSVNVYGKRDWIPLLEINETEITMYYGPTPPSYYSIDWEDEGYKERYGGLMITHGLFMSLAFFVALPMGSLIIFKKYTYLTQLQVSFYDL